MKPALRRAAATAALLAASYGVVATTHQDATAETGRAALGTTRPVTEVTTADTTTSLPSSATDVVVDDVHRQVFISTSGADSVIVTDFDGQITRTITGLVTPEEMTLSPDSSTLYVAEGNAHAPGKIGAVDTQTYAVSHIATPGDVCPESLTYTGGKVWYWYEPCDSSGTGGIGVVDAGTASNVFPVNRPEGVVRALPNRPDRMVLVSQDGFLSVYDVSGTTPALVVEGTSAGSRETCVDAALISGGDQVVTACEPLLEHEIFHTSDLSSAPSIASSAQPAAVAVTPDGRYVAAAVRGTHWPDIFVNDIQGGVPGTRIHQYDFSTELSGTQTGAVAFGGDGRLFAVERPSSGDAVLHVLTDATVPTKLTLNTPGAVAYRGSITGTGTVIGASEGDTVSLTRRDRTGEYPMEPLPVAADGTFRFTDNPGVTGPVTYVVGYPDEYSFAGVKSTTVVRPLPYDVNADGYADTVVGAYAEDIGSVKDAGMFHLLYGGSSGVKTSGSLGIEQNTAGVPGTVEAGDMFGYSNSSGDFNGDGYADIAVSAGAENVGTATDGGAVWIFYGSAGGLRTDNVDTIDIADTVWVGTDHTYLGDALAAGDFDGDGRDDLAIGAAGVDEVIVAQGTPDGLSTTGLQYFSESTDGVPGTRHEDELFGFALATGDVNRDGRADLAVGAIFDYDDRDWSTGSATVLYGGTDGLTGTGAQRFSKDTNAPGSGGSFDEPSGDSSDRFGWQIALADFNGDGGADLAVGAPGAPVTVDGVRKRDAGTLTVLYSSGTQITTTGAVQVSQQTTGMPGTAGQEDQLGTTVAAGDANGDGRAELAAYSHGDHYVTVVPGASGGLGFGSAKGWTQNSSGIPGSTEAGDRWGNSLRFAYVKGATRASLIVGADGENSGKGAFTAIHSTSSGLTGSGSQYVSQNTTGVPGTAENGDGFGTFF